MVLKCTVGKLNTLAKQSSTYLAAQTYLVCCIDRLNPRSNADTLTQSPKSKPHSYLPPTAIGEDFRQSRI